MHIKNGLIVAGVLIMLFPGRIYLPFAVAQEKKARIVIKDEQGPKGHATIGIDETSLDLDAYKKFPLTFATLKTWKFETDNQPPPPEKIKKLDGRLVQLTGFMYPLQEGETIQFFCLLRSTQTCCYGPRPQFNQYVFVEMEKPVAFHRLAPVSCVGTFRVDPAPDEGFIYRMEGKSCELAIFKK